MVNRTQNELSTIKGDLLDYNLVNEYFGINALLELRNPFHV